MAFTLPFGQFDDLKDLPGLAHLTEHLLLSGPGPSDALQAWIETSVSEVTSQAIHMIYGRYNMEYIYMEYMEVEHLSSKPFFWNVFVECFDVDDVGLREEDIGDCQKRYPP